MAGYDDLNEYDQTQDTDQTMPQGGSPSINPMMGMMMANPAFRSRYSMMMNPDYMRNQAALGVMQGQSRGPLDVIAHAMAGSMIGGQMKQNPSQNTDQWAQHSNELRGQIADVMQEHEKSGLPLSHSVAIASQKQADAMAQGDIPGAKAWGMAHQNLVQMMKDEQGQMDETTKQSKAKQDALEGFDKIYPNLDPSTDPELALKREALAKAYSDSIKTPDTNAQNDQINGLGDLANKSKLMSANSGETSGTQMPESEKLAAKLATDPNAIDEKTGRREAWLTALPTSYGIGTHKDLIKGLADNDMDAYTRYGGMNQGQMAVMNAVKKYDPSFNMNDFKAIAKAQDNLTSGDDHKKVIALNTVGKHLGDAIEVVQGLGNANFTPQNFITNWYKKITGDTGPVDYDTAKNFLDKETDNYLSMTKGTAQEQATLKDIVDKSSSMPQLMQNLYRASNMINGKAQVMTNDYASTFGSKQKGDAIYQRMQDKILQPDTRASFDRLKTIATQLHQQQQGGGGMLSATDAAAKGAVGFSKSKNAFVDEKGNVVQ